MKYKIKNIAFLILVIILLFIGFIYLPFILNKNKQAVTKASGINSDPSLMERVTQYQIISCDFDLKERIQALIFEENRSAGLGYRIRFFNTKRNSIFSQSFQSNYTGGTTVKNTTFPQLLKMVKEDCSQFQKGYLDYTGYEDLSEKEKDDRYWEIERKNLGWTYAPHDSRFDTTPTRTKDLVKKKPATSEEIQKEIDWKMENDKEFRETVERRANRVPIGDLYE